MEEKENLRASENMAAAFPPPFNDSGVDDHSNGHDDDTTLGSPPTIPDLMEENHPLDYQPASPHAMTNSVKDPITSGISHNDTPTTIEDNDDDDDDPDNKDMPWPLDDNASHEEKVATPKRAGNDTRGGGVPVPVDDVMARIMTDLERGSPGGQNSGASGSASGSDCETENFTNVTLEEEEHHHKVVAGRTTRMFRYATRHHHHHHHKADGGSHSNDEDDELPPHEDPFAPRIGKTLIWRNVNMTLVSI